MAIINSNLRIFRNASVRTQNAPMHPNCTRNVLNFHLGFQLATKFLVITQSCTLLVSKIYFLSDHGSSIAIAANQNKRNDCIYLITFSFYAKILKSKPIHDLVLNSIVIVTDFERTGKKRNWNLSCPTSFNANFKILKSIQQNIDIINQEIELLRPMGKNRNFLVMKNILVCVHHEDPII